MSRKAAEQHDRLLREINEERAAALRRISGKLESLIDQLRREREPSARASLRREAQKYRWYLEVQREALGLRHHRHLDEFYAIPPESN